MAGRDALQDANSGKNSSQKFYAVRVGRVPGVYGDWASAQKQIEGWPMPKYQGFASRAEAEAFVQAGQARALAPRGGPSPDRDATPVPKKARKNGAAASKSRSKASKSMGLDEGGTPAELGTGPLPIGAVGGFDPSLMINAVTGEIERKADRARVALGQGAATAGPLRIYTDGSSLGNGKQGAVAGVGVYFGAGDER